MAQSAFSISPQACMREAFRQAFIARRAAGFGDVLAAKRAAKREAEYLARAKGEAK